MSTAISLSNYLQRLPQTTVAIRNEQTLSSLDFAQNVANWQNTLAQKVGKRWAVYHTDPYEFLSILFALWHLNRVACLPGDNCVSTIERLAGEVDGFIGEISKAPNLIKHQNKQKLPLSELKLKVLNRESIAVQIYTSGSSGKPKSIHKTIAQLENEITCLNEQWPEVPAAVVFSTVSHQHLYGLTFRIFKPFINGQTIFCRLCEYTEDILNYAKTVDSFVLVSSPSHLSRINTLLDWQSIKLKCKCVYSAASPLIKKDALLTSELLGAKVREIYGSSETGVMAYRIQSRQAGSERWQLLPGVKFVINKNQTISVWSNFIGAKQGIVLSDEINLIEESTFELKGRLDNIVKIEGKRVSLTAIEKLLMSHEWVHEAKTIQITRKRDEIAVVLELTRLGEKQLVLLGRKKIKAILQDLLALDFETVFVPRRWRFVDEIPSNGQGKVTFDAIKALFDSPIVVKWPVVKKIVEEESSVTLDCQIPLDLIYFDGHFDDQAILPGVVQVQWAKQLCDMFFKIEGRFSQLKGIKFTRIVLPATNIQISLKFDSTKQHVIFNYHSKNGSHSSGRICFE